MWCASWWAMYSIWKWRSKCGNCGCLAFRCHSAGVRPFELAAQRFALADILREHVGGRPLSQRDKHLIAIGIIVRHDGRLFGQHAANRSPKIDSIR